MEMAQRKSFVVCRTATIILDIRRKSYKVVSIKNPCVASETAMSLLLPVDDNGNPIPVLGFERLGTTRLAVAQASVRTAQPLPDGTQMISLIANGPCRFEVGDASVTADAVASPFLYPGIYVDVPLRRGERYVAFIAENEDCVAYVIGRA